MQPGVGGWAGETHEVKIDATHTSLGNVFLTEPSMLPNHLTSARAEV